MEQSNTEGGIGKSVPRTFTVDAAMPPVLLAAGDIAGCDTFGDEATALLLDGLPGTVAAIGDLAYQKGTAHSARSPTYTTRGSARGTCAEATWR